MNVKVANLVAVQFGVLLGIASWLAYSRFEPAEPRIAAVEKRESPAAPSAAVAPISDLGSQVTRALDADADREKDQSIGEQPVQVTLPHQYSPEAVEQYTALAAQQYYQQIAPRRYASAGVANSSIAPATPIYTQVAQEPAAVSTDYAEPVQTAAYAEPTQIAFYQPQFIVFSNQRRFPNRRRPTLQPAGGTPVTHRRPDRAGPHQNVCEVTPRKNPDAPSCQPGQESRPRGRR
jgi:hypothetical protein